LAPIIGYIFGSSRNSGEGGSDFQEEVVVISISIGLSFEGFDFVVDALEQGGMQSPTAVGQDALKIAA